MHPELPIGPLIPLAPVAARRPHEKRQRQPTAAVDVFLAQIELWRSAASTGPIFPDGHDRRPDPVARFQSFLVEQKPNECWMWSGGHCKGYPVFWFGVAPDGSRRIGPASRFAWALERGRIPEGHRLRRICGNRGCINPAHARLVTAADVMSTNGRACRGSAVRGAKLTTDIAREARRRNADGERCATLAREYSVTWTTMKKLLDHRSWVE